jgi:hypothetical protein
MPQVFKKAHTFIFYSSKYRLMFCSQIFVVILKNRQKVNKKQIFHSEENGNEMPKILNKTKSTSSGQHHQKLTNLPTPRFFKGTVSPVRKGSLYRPWLRHQALTI